MSTCSMSYLTQSIYRTHDQSQQVTVKARYYANADNETTNMLTKRCLRGGNSDNH